MLFKEVDADGSGYLDRAEVEILAEKMGLRPQLDDPKSTLTVDKLIDDIEQAKDDDEEGGVDDGNVTYDELLPWFLNVGRSYLPPTAFVTVPELEEPAGEKLKEIFDSIDADCSNEVNKHEVETGCLALYPYLDTDLVSKAFEASDEDCSGNIGFDEFDELVRCLQFLNKNRHSLEEAVHQFDSGVGEDEFYLGVTALGIPMSDKKAKAFFTAECKKLGGDMLTAHQFLMWMCRHECADKASVAQQAEEAAARAQEDLESSMNEFGDIFIEDLAKVVFTSHRGGYSSEKVERKHAMLREATAEALDRGRMLSAGIEAAMQMHDSFPIIPPHVLTNFIASARTDVYYAGQNIITQGRAEDTFFVMRRGKAEMLVDNENDDDEEEEGPQFVGTVSAGDGIGEMALMYGTRRAMTVRATGPVEVLILDRASYEIGITLLPPEERNGRLVKMMQLFWALVSGPDGSKRPEVDYAAYLKYHLRVSRTLTNDSDMDDFEEDEEREVAQEDWGEDTKRFGLRMTDTLSMPMFFDSLYQMVDLWAGDLEVGFTEFLDKVFYNIAEWVELDDRRNKAGVAHWKFKALDAVDGQGEALDAVQDAAREKLESAVKEKEEAAAKAVADRHEEVRWMDLTSCTVLCV